MAGLGLSFIPGGEDDPTERDRERRTARHQQAVQLLTMRMPRIRGGGALAPAVLLEGPGSMGSPFARSAIAQTQLQPQVMAPTQLQPYAMAPTSQPASSGFGAAKKKPGAAKPQLSPTAQAVLQMAGLGSGTLPTPHFSPGIATHDPAVLAAEQENMKTYNESPNYGGVPGWTPPPSYPVGYEGQSGQQGYKTPNMSPLKTTFKQKYENLLAGMNNEFLP